MGTDNPPTNIVSSLDLGLQYTYQPDSPLLVNTTYYWRIESYNNVGTANNCPVWSFSIYNPSPTMSYPNGGELWLSGTTKTIRWNASNPVPQVKLYVSFDNATQWSFITSTDGTKGFYHYQVPAANSTNCRIKITSALDESLYDISDNVYSNSTSTSLPKVVLTAPNVTGLKFGVGQSVNISWTRQNVSLVALDFSLDDGFNWREIVTGLNTNSYSWIIPDTTSNTCRVRVRSSLTTEVNDISDSYFGLFKLEILSPIGGEVITGDYSGLSIYPIYWTVPDIDNIQIEYSLNNGVTWTEIVSSTSARPGLFFWTVPGIPTKYGKIRISSVSNPEISDFSDSVFVVRNPIKIMNVNGGGFVTDTSLFNIRWFNQEIADNVSVHWEYSLDSSNWLRINSVAVPVINQYMEWFINIGLQNNVWLRAVQSINSRILTKSEASFKVTDKQLRILSPAIGDTLGIEGYANIAWHSFGCTTVIIEYTTDFGNTWLQIAANIPSSQGAYLWQVPNTPSSLCRIRIRDMTYSYMIVESEGEFSIFPLSFTAAFHANTTIGFSDLTVQFYDDSIGFVDSWGWDFDNNGTLDSNDQNPIWIYRQSGFFTVSLTISNDVTISTSLRHNYIYVYPLVADFESDQTLGYLPITVHFNNLTNSTVYYSQWDFDSDGIIDSTDENPIWTYTFPGTYTVSQWVSNGFDSDTEIRANYITVSLNPAITRYVPTQYPTIQAAINASNDGDYIIVADGTYFENLLIEGKSITLASYFFLDGDSTHIANTIIDGSNALNPDQASTLTILPGTGRPNTTPHIIGFTIRSGSGRRIIQNEGGTTIEKRVGGGIYIRQADPIFSYNKIEDNDAEDEGGGSYAFQSIPNHGGMIDPAIGLYNPGGNYFANNRADIGADIYIYGVTQRDPLKARNCSFEVMSVADTTVSNYWVNSSGAMDFVGSSGRLPAITTDIYVATNGSDIVYTGTSTDSPFKTIDHALSRIYATADNPLTIHIASGTYSPSLTGEKYPLQMVKHVSLYGSGVEETFLDAEASADFPKRVLNLDKVEGVNISGLTIMNGFVTMAKNYNGGGIGIINSQATLSNVLLAGSSSAGNGAGIYAFQSSVSADSLWLEYNTALGSGGGLFSMETDLELTNSAILNNSADRNGAGLALDNGSITIRSNEIASNLATGYQSKGGGISITNATNAQIKQNTLRANNADLGGGIYLQNNSSIHLDRNYLTNNLADFNGGGLFINTSDGLITNNLIANNTASQRGGAIYSYSSPQFINNTITNNKANQQGGALYQNTGSPVFLNSIFWGNVSGSTNIPNQIYLYGEDADPAFQYCNIQSGLSGIELAPGISYSGAYEDNLDSDPLFSSVSEGAGSYFPVGTAAFMLSEGSPCIDSGDPETETTLIPLDLAGNPRLDNNRIDLGAYESVHYQGAMISAEPAMLDFGIVNIQEDPVNQQITITNTGNMDLLISDIAFETSGIAFSFDAGLRTSIIEPDSSQIITLSFDPLSTGLHENALLISSNALNQAVLRIPVCGTGIDISTSYPSNVLLQVIGDDVNLSWDPVLSDPEGNPYTPAGYIILYSENADTVLDNYFYLDFTIQPSFVHNRVARYRNKMFYQIIAVDDRVRASLQELLRSRTEQHLNWKEVKKLIDN